MSKEKNDSKKKKNDLWIVMIVIGTVFLCAVAVMLFLYSNKNDEEGVKTESDASESIQNEAQDYSDFTTIQYEGKKYKYNPDIKTILFMGIDQRDIGSEDGGGEAGRSDALILLLVNAKEETVAMFSLSRNAITEVQMTNDDGERVTSADMHLALQYSFGDGKEKSCQLTRDAVSNLLYGIPINYYVSMDLDGLDHIVDVLGGVSILMKEDYTRIDPSFVKGETVKMTGEQTEKYIRHRDVSESGSNEKRVERQEDFLKAFVVQLKESMGDDGRKLQSMWGMVSPFLITDLSADMVGQMASYEMLEESYRLPGENVLGEHYDEFYVDDDQLRELLIKILYKENEV